MAIQFNAYKDFICIFGRKLQGKSVFAKYIIKHIKRYVIYDRHHEYGDCGYIVYYPSRIEPAFNKGYTHLVFQPRHFNTQEFWEVCKAVLSLSNLTFVIEEIHYYAHARGYKIPKNYLPNLLETIICGGRHQGIGLICLTRRPSTTHADLKSNCNYVVIFNMTYNKDIEYVGEWIGLSKTEYHKIKDLPRWQSLLYDVDQNTITPQGACPYYEVKEIPKGTNRENKNR